MANLPTEALRDVRKGDMIRAILIKFGLLNGSAVEAEEDLVVAFSERWQKTSASCDTCAIVGCKDINGTVALIAM